MPPSTETQETVLHELDMLARRIKEARTTDDLRRLLNLMNSLKFRLPADAFVAAKYQYVRGALYIKAAVVPGNWITSAGESLYYALDMLEQASGHLKGLIEHSPTESLVQFQQDCVYEAMVAITTLRTWGRNLPEQLPETGCLPGVVQRKIAHSLSHSIQLRSRFA